MSNINTVQLPKDGADYHCTYGHDCRRVTTLGISMTDLHEYMKLRALWNAECSKGNEEPSIMRALCTDHLDIVNETIQELREIYNV